MAKKKRKSIVAQLAPYMKEQMSTGPSTKGKPFSSPTKKGLTKRKKC